MQSVWYIGYRKGGGVCGATEVENTYGEKKIIYKPDVNKLSVGQKFAYKQRYWICRLHRFVFHRTAYNPNDKSGYIDMADDHPWDITKLKSIEAIPQIDVNKPSKFYLEFMDGTEYKCKIDDLEEYNTWMEILSIFVKYHTSLPNGYSKHTYKSYPIPDQYKLAILDCLQYISKYGTGEEGVFRAGKTDLVQLKQVIIAGGLSGLEPNNTNPSIDGKYDILGVAFLIKALLRSLPETLLTNYMLPHFLAASEARDLNEIITCVNDLPPANREILQLLLETCILCCMNPGAKMSVDSMAKVVGPNFLDTENAQLLIQIKTGEIPLVQLFELLMYNMRRVFGGKGPQMPRKVPKVLPEENKTMNIDKAVTSPKSPSDNKDSKDQKVSESVAQIRSSNNNDSNNINVVSPISTDNKQQDNTNNNNNDLNENKSKTQEDCGIGLGLNNKDEIKTSNQHNDTIATNSNINPITITSTDINASIIDSSSTNNNNNADTELTANQPNQPIATNTQIDNNIIPPISTHSNTTNPASNIVSNIDTNDKSNETIQSQMPNDTDNNPQAEQTNNNSNSNNDQAQVTEQKLS